MVINEVNSNEWNYDSHQYNTSYVHYWTLVVHNMKIDFVIKFCFRTGQHKEETGTCTIDRSTSPQNIAATFSERNLYALNFV